MYLSSAPLRTVGLHAGTQAASYRRGYSQSHCKQEAVAVSTHTAHPGCQEPWGAARWFTQQKGHRTFPPSFGILPAAPAAQLLRHIIREARSAHRGSGQAVSPAEAGSTAHGLTCSQR